ncbi:hypothetical protein IFM89_003573 [Coptis chinensis]|uniref:Uncharacterized protein n=1 Tax=Coptis chinensis TaxID=261450 RepID=A0A835LYJ3_9MAGN|nr:hypothetical protein IFM89_003573 [Coptis chinensis]
MSRTSTDGFRFSVSSQGSGPDDTESLGDVYVWGAVWSDGITNNSGSPHLSKTDVLLPKPLKSNVVLDVHQIACGVRHAALVTRQGEVFTWGEESRGRLGHGIDKDFSRPQLVEFLAVNQVEYVACGEYHTCATSVAGDLFIWGDGTLSAALGHTTDINHWLPKRVSGPLEGLQVLSIACGTWHSALATSNGKLFTFGDGTFGVLGHGNRDSVTYPREVETLSGLKTVKVACGVWHTAAIVEVIEQTGENSLNKLFTWGDGDKHRLGHGDKEARLIPTFISSLNDYNFQQVSCGHNVTVALTISGHVFTMGSNVYGEVGNPACDGKIPCLVKDKLTGQFIEEISCGAYHVAVLTTRNEVFTWGRGANGRLGHGDMEDRKAPTLVEALKDKLVKSVCCGSNFTTSICIHKWVSGADQSFCSGCRQAFGFTRKRRNCYNCGLVYCHSCSSKKTLRAALAPTPDKPYRVCDPCYAKLKATEDGNTSAFTRRSVTPQRSVENRGRFDGIDARSSKVLLSPSVEPVKYLEVKSVKDGKSDSFSVIRASLVPSLLQLKDIAFPSRFSALQDASTPVSTSIPQPTLNTRPASPYSRKPSPPRSPVHAFSKSAVDTLKKTNELLNLEIFNLQNELKSLRQKSEIQDVELHKSEVRAQEAASLAEQNSSKLTEAKEVLKSITTQLKAMTEKLPPEVYDGVNFKALHIKLEFLFNTKENDASEVSISLPSDCLEPEEIFLLDKLQLVSTSSANIQVQKMDDTANTAVAADLSQSAESNGLSGSHSEEAGSHQSVENSSSKPRVPTASNEGQRPLIEQFEPGVYITLVQLANGTKLFKRVRFSKRRFNEQQAGDWWRENSSRVLQKYNNQDTEASVSRSSVSAASSSSTAEESVTSSLISDPDLNDKK